MHLHFLHLLNYLTETQQLNQHTAMQILFNTDKTISGDERTQAYYTAQIVEELKRYETLITRIDVHLSDENGKKEGLNDIICLLETKLEGKKTITVSCQTDTVELAVLGALEKLKRSIEKILDRSQDH